MWKSGFLIFELFLYSLAGKAMSRRVLTYLYKAFNVFDKGLY